MKDQAQSKQQTLQESTIQMISSMKDEKSVRIAYAFLSGLINDTTPKIASGKPHA